MTTKPAKSVEELTARVAELEKKLETASNGLSRYTQAASVFSLGTDNAGTAVGDFTKSLNDLGEAAGSIGGMVGVATGTVTAFTSVFPGVGKAVQAAVSTLNVAGKAMKTVGKSARMAGEFIAEAFDTPSRSLREFDQTIFNLGKQFGGTIEEASKFADALNVETSSEFSRSLYVTKQQMVDFAKATSRTSLSLDQMNESVDTGIGTTTMFAVAAAQAAAMGVTMSEAAELFNTAMNKQGKSAQEAANLIGGFSAVAKETGLRASTVASTLNGAVQGFTKLGMSADFGRPILEGFGRTMKDMGLGIENATSLTTSLSTALAGLTTDYASAYIMFQKGGLDIGGGGSGGALGASIGLQAAMLEAEKTGDQSGIANQMVHGLRDTLASFTGGDIVTVQQAAESPELQSQFYVQQQMLQKQFGVSNAQDATRVLDMLSQLDEATRTGNTEAQQDLEKQLRNEMEGRDKNLDIMEKINQEVAIQSNLLAVEQRILVEGFRMIAEPGKDHAISAIQSGGEILRSKAAGAGAKLIKGITDGQGGVPGMSRASLEKLGSQIEGQDEAARSRAAERLLAGNSSDVIGDAGRFDSNFKNIDGNTDNISKRIEDVAIAVANQISKGDNDQDRENFQRIAESLEKALETKLVTIDVTFSPEASQWLETNASVAQDLSQGSGNTATR